MEKDYLYREITTREEVYKEDALEYVYDKLGIEIKPAGEYGTWTEDQLAFIDMVEEWYFSGNWVKYYKDEEQYKEVVNEELNVYDGF